MHAAGTAEPGALGRRTCSVPAGPYTIMHHALLRLRFVAVAVAWHGCYADQTTVQMQAACLLRPGMIMADLIMKTLCLLERK